MIPQMERKRVLYSAKTKTAKVIQPTWTQRPLSLPTSLEAGEHPAPLASMESDVLVVSKWRNGTHKPSVLCRQTRKPASETNICDEQASDVSSAAFKQEHSRRELRDSTPPRSYVKMRSAKTPELHKEHSYVRENKNVHRQRSGQQLSNGLSPAEFKAGLDNRFDWTQGGHRVPAFIHDIQTVSRQTTNPHVTNNSLSLVEKDKKTEQNNDFAAKVKRHSDSYTQQVVIPKKPPPVAPKPKEKDSKSRVPNGSKSGRYISDAGNEDSSLDIQSSQVVRLLDNQASKENHIDSSTKVNGKNLENSLQTCNNTVHSFHKPCRDSSKPVCKPSITSALTQSKKESTRSEHSNRENSSSQLLPEMSLPFRNMRNDSGPLPEMHNMSTLLNTTNVRPRSTPGAPSCASHISQCKTNPRKPLAAINISSNTTLSHPKENRENVQYTEHNTCDIQVSTNTDFEYSQNIFESTEQSKDQHSTNTTQAEPVPFENSYLFLVPEFKPRWKRNSMRLATHGYTSMSDLTNSLECLTGTEHKPSVIKTETSENPDHAVDEYHEKQSEINPDSTFTSDGELEISESESIKNQREKSCFDSTCDKTDETEETKTDYDEFIVSIPHEEPIRKIERNGVKRFSYKMATSSVTDIFTMEDDMCGQLDNTIQTSVTVDCSESRDFQVFHHTQECQPETFPVSDDVINNEPPLPDSANQKRLHLNRLNQEEQTGRIKRLSFVLATSSISDLTFPDAEFNIVSCHVPNEKTNGQPDAVNTTIKSACISCHTPESQHRQFTEDSCSSGGRHSSFGSVYSCGMIEKVKQLQDKVKLDVRYQPYCIKNVKDSTLDYSPNGTGDLTGSDGSSSGDTTFYYTASSDNSFVTTDGDPLNSSHLSDISQGSPGRPAPDQLQRAHSLPSQEQKSPRLHAKDHGSSTLSPRDRRRVPRPSEDQKSHRLPVKDHGSSTFSPRDQKRVSRPLDDQWSPRLSSQDQILHGMPSQDQKAQELPSQDQTQRSRRLPLQDQGQWSPKNNRLERPQNSTHRDSAPRKVNSLPHHAKTSKHPSPINNALQCYGCGLSERNPAQTQPRWNRNNSVGTSSLSRNWEKNDNTRERSLEDLKRNNSNHLSERTHARHPTRSPRHLPVNIRTFAKTDIPARDQSSTSGIPSTPSASSLNSTAEDFTWDLTPRFPPSLGRPRRKLYAGFDSQPLPMDSFLTDSSSVYSVQSCGSWGASRSAEVESSSRTPEPSPFNRAVSSIASSTYSSVRRVPEDDVFDLFTFTDKHINMCNFYLNKENSAIDNCIKDSFFGKTFSNDSLESFLSDGTIVGLEHPESADLSPDYTKSCLNPVASRSGTYKNTAKFVESEKITNERRQLDRLNNSCGYERGSRLSNNSSLCTGDVVNNKIQPNTLTALSCVASPKSRLTSKGEYFSSKAILDLILTSEKSLQKSAVSLERQTQKMCEVVLRCNEIDRPSAKEYHF